MLLNILENHFLYPSLTKIREHVPSTYPMQFWLSAHVEQVNHHGQCITGYASHKDDDRIALMSINKAKLRTLLELPSKRDLNLLKYSESPSDSEICQFVNFSGYNQNLTNRTLFRKGRLPPLWNTVTPGKNRNYQVSVNKLILVLFQSKYHIRV